MTKLFISVLILIFTFTSCKNSEQTRGSTSGTIPYRIDMEKSLDKIGSVTLSSIGKKLEYISLETNKDCLLDNIVRIAFCDSLVFVCDRNKLLKFDQRGKYLDRIGSQGRGPGEYISIWDFCVEKKSKMIFLISTGTRTVLSYDFEGHFRRSFKLPSNSTQLIMKDTNSIMFYRSNVSGFSNSPTFSWDITDTYGNLLSKISYSLIRKSMPGFSVRISPMYLFNGSVHFMEFGIDTLYHFNGPNKEPYAIFNFGSSKMDPDPLVTTPGIKERLSGKVWIWSMQEDQKNFYMNLIRGLEPHFISGIYSKQTSEVIILEGESFINDLDNGPAFWPEVVYNDSILIDYIEASKLIAFIDQKKSGNSDKNDIKDLNQLAVLRNRLEETSNPVLLILR